uniref:Uncharacterized protein n=1 Tax=Theileria annulata TaxID=5874 RepID=A0A3B0NC03_THEAN
MTSQNANNLEKADKLLSYLAKKVEENKPANVVHFIVDVLCTYYPTHSPYFAKVWHYDKELEVEKQHVREFFKHNNSTSTIAQHFINAGFDCLDSLTFLTTDILEEIQGYNNVQWLPGHKVRVNQIFQNINKLVKEFKDLMKTQKRTKLHFIAGMGQEKTTTHYDYTEPVRGGNATVGFYQHKPNLNQLLPGDDTMYKTQTKLRNLYNLDHIASLSAEAATTKAVDALNNEIYGEACKNSHYTVKNRDD